MSDYKVWPVGQLPKEFQRPELDQIKEKGYEWNDPRDVVEIFEKKVAEFAGAKYGIAVDCCSHALFLALQYVKRHLPKEEGTSVKKLGGIGTHGGVWKKIQEVKTVPCPTIKIPKYTYVSVPMQIKHAGFEYEFKDIKWNGVYQLKPFNIFDGATRWTRGMYKGGLHCLSFQIKKRVPIGRGGMILTDSLREANYLRKIRYDGRDLDIPYMNDDFEYMGWHYYMTPEDAARGILLMDEIPSENEDTGGWENYSDLSEKVIFNE
tara:strand:- start:1104 stop:1892 length:789 start_codon:yes stop_codon:yes gene_type:complete